MVCFCSLVSVFWWTHSPWNTGAVASCFLRHGHQPTAAAPATAILQRRYVCPSAIELDTVWHGCWSVRVYGL